MTHINRNTKTGILDTIGRTATNFANIVEDLSELSSSTIKLGNIKIQGMIIEEKIQQVNTYQSLMGDNEEYETKCNQIKSGILNQVLEAIENDTIKF